VSRINTAANAPVQTIAVGNVPVALASGASGVWVANQGDNTVYQIDPSTGTVTMKRTIGLAPDGVAVGPDAVWVANGGDGTISRIDPATGSVSGPDHVGAGPDGVAVTPAAVWVANLLDLTVSELDPATGRVTATIGVGDGPRAIAAGKDGVWVSDEFDATLARIDPRTGRVVRKVFLGSSPQGLALAGSSVWVAARPFAAASHRGGSLTVVTQWLPQRDPVLAAGIADLPAMTVVYDGWSRCARQAARKGSPSCLTWPPGCRCRPAAAKPTPSHSGQASVTRAACSRGRPTSAAASSASSALALIPTTGLLT
jgi:YVTN family beta-propeller protein